MAAILTFPLQLNRRAGASRPIPNPTLCLWMAVVLTSIGAPAPAEPAAPTPVGGGAETATPPLTITVQDTAEVWRNTTGGLRVGDAVLNKLQVILDLDGAAFGRPSWTVHLQYFRTDGDALSGGRVGDIQTVSNIEAPNVDRLMEAWVERRFRHGLTLRAGLMDLNADFDSITPAGLFIDSSHGIAPDLSKSGLNGPSIFPVSALGAHLTWSPSAALTFRAAAFDGVPGDPGHPDAFVAVTLNRHDGALLIGQADSFFTNGVQASLGVWGYTASFDRLDLAGLRQRGQGGVYGFVEGPLPFGSGWSGWLRVGTADARVAVVDGYLGLGLVKAEPLPGRRDDRLGFAVARASLGGPARRAGGLPDAETTFEVTYRYQVNAALSLQPDVQYVRHPASQPGLRNAVVVGLRASFSMSHGFRPGALIGASGGGR